MAVVVVNEMPQGNQSFYDQVNPKVMPDGQLPEGCQLHIAGPSGGGWRVITVWDSEEQFQQFRNDKLIPAMEGMSFETPKGKMTFRKEDHQAMQSMYHFKIKNDPAFAWGVPELVREIKPEEMDVPIKNKR